MTDTPNPFDELGNLDFTEDPYGIIAQYREVLELTAETDPLVAENESAFSVRPFRSAQERARWALANLPKGEHPEGGTR